MQRANEALGGFLVFRASSRRDRSGIAASDCSTFRHIKPFHINHSHGNAAAAASGRNSFLPGLSFKAARGPRLFSGALRRLFFFPETFRSQSSPLNSCSRAAARNLESIWAGFRAPKGRREFLRPADSGPFWLRRISLPQNSLSSHADSAPAAPSTSGLLPVLSPFSRNAKAVL